jgi:hypothetical protein
MVKSAIVTTACIIVGATLGGFFGYRLNVWLGGVKDPESLWLWSLIVGAIVGAIAAGLVLAYLRSDSKSNDRRTTGG